MRYPCVRCGEWQSSEDSCLFRKYRQPVSWEVATLHSQGKTVGVDSAMCAINGRDNNQIMLYTGKGGDTM